MEIIRDLGGEAGFLDEKSNSVRLCKAACFSSIPLSLWAQRLSSVTRTASLLQERANSWARTSNPPTSAPAWRSSSLHSAPKADPLSIYSSDRPRIRTRRRKTPLPWRFHRTRNHLVFLASAPALRMRAIRVTPRPLCAFAQYAERVAASRFAPYAAAFHFFEYTIISFL